MKNKKRKLLGVLAVGIILLIPLLWLQANEEVAKPKGYPDTGGPKNAIEPPDYHTYPAYDPTPMNVNFGLTGLVVYSNSNGIALIDYSTKKISPILLNEFDYTTIDPETEEPVGGQLGTEGGGRFDVAMNRKGKLALISNFGDSKIFFVNLASGTPVVEDMVRINMFAEDIDIHPSGKWALVADGGFSRDLTIIHIPTRTFTTYKLPSGSYGNCIAISSDGKTVLTADYFQGRVYALLFNPVTGTLTYKQKIKLWKYGTNGTEPWPFLYRPVNVTISPDGRTALLSNVNRSIEPGDIDPTDPTQVVEGANVAVLRIDSPGHITRMPDVIMPYEVYGGQSIVFSRDGTRAFCEMIYSIDWTMGDTAQEIQVLSVKGPDRVTRTGAVRMQTYRGTSQLFGVDTMATSPDGKYLYVTNPTLSGGQPIIEVVDLKRLQSVKQITVPIDYPDPMRNWPDPPLPPDPADPNDWIEYLIPVGIAFPEAPVDLALDMSVNNASPAVGDTVTFTVEIENVGPGIGFDIKVINDPLPAGLTFISATPSWGSYDHATGYWNIPKMNPKNSETLDIKAHVSHAGTLVNSAYIRNQSGYDPKKVNNKASETIVAK
jgi:uncharacterized repeat protein (TIGR01451 family)